MEKYTVDFWNIFRYDRGMKEKKSVLTIALIVINIAVFIIETIAGGSENTQVALRFGAAYAPLIFSGQYYRLFTAMFLHFGAFHLLANMISLGVLGPTVEKLFGKVRFLLVYLIGGIAGNLLSILLDVAWGRNALSAGASGAIFALFGAYLVMALSKKFTGLSISRVIIAIVISLVPGLEMQSVNVSAHLGGVIGGFIVSLILLPTIGGGRGKSNKRNKRLTYDP